ncbi:hypothetical protein [Microcoleus sp. Pol12A5]|uniref:hypothetical protein n=1 Tax=Microcoleus sp. Pol12A5 TaxID=3055392 RepID=UPI002FCF15C5
MAVLECVKPGAKLGQIILAVDLTVAGAVHRVLAKIQDLGYHPKIRHVNYSSGVRVLSWQFSKTNSTSKQLMMTTCWRIGYR